MKYTFLTPEELLAEQSFINFLQTGNEAGQDFWKKWIEESSENAQLASTAKKIFDASVIRENLSPENLAKAEEKFIKNIFHPIIQLNPFYKNRKFLSIAAAFILVIFTGLIYFLSETKETHIQTSKGELSQKILPDGSEVTLNSKSRIAFSKNWKTGSTREVWLDGEAFFHVQKTPQKSTFIVHAGNCDIIVTGTKFNVLNKNGITQVLLDEGSVTLQTKEGKEIKMKPGDFAEVKNNDIQKEAVERIKVLAWKDHKLVFDNTTLEDAIAMINEQYETNIKIADSSILKTTITGILPNDNLEVLLRSLEATMNFKIERKDNEISITKP